LDKIYNDCDQFIKNHATSPLMHIKVHYLKIKKPLITEAYLYSLQNLS
jgi:hypothetical protein